MYAEKRLDNKNRYMRLEMLIKMWPEDSRIEFGRFFALNDFRFVLLHFGFSPFR